MAQGKLRTRTKRDKSAGNGGDDTPTIELEPGPRKQHSSDRPARFTHHKKRAMWFRARISWPLREAPPRKLDAERRRTQRSLPKLEAAADWELAGPTNIGGRCTAIVCDPRNPDRIWIGAAGGGVWHSSNAGKRWRAQWRAHTVLRIGALAIDPGNPDTIYCGTGEANLSADSYAGDGVYRSVNAGRSWKHWAASAKHGLPRRIGCIAVDPFDAKHVLVGGVGFGRVSADNDFGGLYETRDGGANWSRAPLVLGNYWCHCVVFDPSTAGKVFASFTGPGLFSGLHRSTDGALAWVQLKTGLPSTDRIGRATIALAPSNPRVVYAICADAGHGHDDVVLGVFRSVNGGNSWAAISGSHFDHEGQMSYGNALAVHPQDPDHVICGGVDLHRTGNAGGMWFVASQWDAERGTAGYAHADHHALLMPAGAPGRVYSANDGGLDVSEDGGKTWQNRSAGLSVTMYYDIDIAQTDARVFGGGAQDNGTLITRTGAKNDSFELLGGDGGWMVVDPRAADHIYASFQFGGMYRFRAGTRKKVSPPFKPEESGGMWMVYIAIDPNHSDVVYTGNQRLYRTRNDGLSWDALTPVLDGSPISAIEIPVADSNIIYVATENGGFFRSLDGGASFSANLASGALPGLMITRIAARPGHARDIVITIANSGSSHVFRSTDAGGSWMDIDGGQLPDVPHHAALYRSDAPGDLYVCNDAGVYLSDDDGAHWINATGKLPQVMVVDLVYQAATETLYAATYGRSIWRMKLG